VYYGVILVFVAQIYNFPPRRCTSSCTKNISHVQSCVQFHVQFRVQLYVQTKRDAYNSVYQKAEGCTEICTKKAVHVQLHAQTKRLSTPRPRSDACVSLFHEKLIKAAQPTSILCCWTLICSCPALTRMEAESCVSVT